MLISEIDKERITSVVKHTHTHTQTDRQTAVCLGVIYTPPTLAQRRIVLWYLLHEIEDLSDYYNKNGRLSLLTK